MARRPESPQASVDAMCRHMTESTAKAPRTIRFYRESMHAILGVLGQEGRHAMPQDFTAEDVVWLLNYYNAHGMTVQTRKGYFSALRTWLHYYGNRCIDEVPVSWPNDARPNVDWLTLDQAQRLLVLPMSPVQQLIVHCELCLGMRRVEVLRLTLHSFAGDYVDILGKGHQGGKPRRIPYHRDTAAVLDRYLRWRSGMIAMVQAERPSVAVPDRLLIWSRGPHIYTYCAKGTGIDAIIKDLGAQIGYRDASNHTLRRTFGRMMYRSGVPVATIAKLLGHSSIEQTLRYIGVDMDDMTVAMSQFEL